MQHSQVVSGWSSGLCFLISLFKVTNLLTFIFIFRMKDIFLQSYNCIFGPLARSEMKEQKSKLMFQAHRPKIKRPKATQVLVTTNKRYSHIFISETSISIWALVYTWRQPRWRWRCDYLGSGYQDGSFRRPPSPIYGKHSKAVFSPVDHSNYINVSFYHFFYETSVCLDWGKADYNNNCLIKDINWGCTEEKHRENISFTWCLAVLCLLLSKSKSR